MELHSHLDADEIEVFFHGTGFASKTGQPQGTGRDSTLRFDLGYCRILRGICSVCLVGVWRRNAGAGMGFPVLPCLSHLLVEPTGNPTAHGNHSFKLCESKVSFEGISSPAQARSIHRGSAHISSLEENALSNPTRNPARTCNQLCLSHIRRRL